MIVGCILIHQWIIRRNGVQMYLYARRALEDTPSPSAPPHGGSYEAGSARTSLESEPSLILNNQSSADVSANALLEEPTAKGTVRLSPSVGAARERLQKILSKKCPQPPDNRQDSRRRAIILEFSQDDGSPSASPMGSPAGLASPQARERHEGRLQATLAEAARWVRRKSQPTHTQGGINLSFISTLTGTALFLVYLLSFPAIAGGGRSFVSALTNNLLPGMLVLTLSGWFGLVVMDHVAFLLRNMLLKVHCFWLAGCETGTRQVVTVSRWQYFCIAFYFPRSHFKHK